MTATTAIDSTAVVLSSLLSAMCDFEETAEDFAEQIADSIVEDTVHCSVCRASHVCGDAEPFVVLDPPGEQQQAAERGCEQVKLCESCARDVLDQLVMPIADQYMPKRRGLPDKGRGIRILAAALRVAKNCTNNEELRPAYAAIAEQLHPIARSTSGHKAI